MYHDLKQIYWWDDMKKDNAEFVAMCPNCQQVKAEHLKSAGLTQIKRLRHGSGRPLIWTSWLDFRRLGDSMSIYGLLLSQPTLSLCSLLTKPRIMRVSTLMRL